jgi:ADP-dependent NAD(P)H-hydrate dehydratase / NAD(P)H-hydrate epimerase
VIPVLTPGEMAEVDRSAPEPVEVLVERAGYAVAAAARNLMGGTYGRRVVVVAGPGNNGADGRVAARRLAGWGAKLEVLEAAGLGGGQPVGPADLVIDAAYGTGLSRAYDPPDPGPAPVLAVDIPSGLSGLTGTGASLGAQATVAFAAYKPGLLLGAGRQRCGRIQLAGIGLDGLAGARASMWLVDDGDLALLPRRMADAHKWQTAVLVVGGSSAMNGAPLMVAHGAMRAGAGYALVGVPGGPAGGGLPPGEQVGVDLPDRDWVPAAARAASRVKALAVGPGLADRARGPDGETGPDTPVGWFLYNTEVPAVVDADAITALGGIEGVSAVTAGRSAPVILTPHEGEYAKLTGHAPLEDRITDVRQTARQTGAVVLLKGSTTVVAHPDGRVLVAAAGRSNLATAGTGDTLTGIITAFLARGLEPLEAAALGAHAHGRAAGRGRPEGLVASDLPDLVADYLSQCVPPGPDPGGAW